MTKKWNLGDAFGPQSGVRDDVRYAFFKDFQMHDDGAVLKRFLVRRAIDGLSVRSYVEAIADRFGRQWACEIWNPQTQQLCQEEACRLAVQKDKTTPKKPQNPLLRDLMRELNRLPVLPSDLIEKLLAEKKANVEADQEPLNEPQMEQLRLLIENFTVYSVPDLNYDPEIINQSPWLSVSSSNWIRSQIRSILQANDESSLQIFVKKCVEYFPDTFTRIFNLPFRKELKEKFLSDKVNLIALNEWLCKEPHPEMTYHGLDTEIDRLKGSDKELHVASIETRIEYPSTTIGLEPGHEDFSGENGQNFYGAGGDWGGVYGPGFYSPSFPPRRWMRPLAFRGAMRHPIFPPRAWGMMRPMMYPPHRFSPYQMMPRIPGIGSRGKSGYSLGKNRRGGHKEQDDIDDGVQIGGAGGGGKIDFRKGARGVNWDVDPWSYVAGGGDGNIGRGGYAVKMKK